VADIGNPFYTELVSVIHGSLGRAGYRTVLINERTDLRGDAGVQPLLRSGLVDGAIVATATLDEHTRALLAGERTPIVLVNRELGGVQRDTVVSDNRTGGARVAELLAELGHTRIAHIAGPANTSTARERAAGFGEALGRIGLSLDPGLQRAGDYSHRDGYRWALELLGLERPPTAIFCDNDVIALGALDAARGRAVAVPRELSIVGFDDIALAAWESFRLTTIRQPLADMAEEAVRLLVDRVERADGAAARRIVFPTELIQRGTTAAVEAR
jgi:LacI family transcriptional regulator